ncbi:dihydroxyacetone kinase family protein [Aureimonas altamirensis]|uniref:dihydroxyacetone kinase family protein n=1 Tax=Aureimonas altamirensis TaxID=370622 RepID=UPI001E65A33F|nr:dihydroxyacetone kinase family protein [Aureimonas altamirensis]UHD46384.1 dihydroxyacetone kinase family protein [Aureimonas altamirensis]
MTHIIDDPETFASAALEGFCSLYPDHVQHVRGGALRARKTRDQKVAVVIGGGSGHYPAFLGYVGPGLADAAVCGDIFASPSTEAIARIGRLASSGMGVIFGFGNYAGDVLNFGAAAERLRSEGIDARTLAVTDDIASAVVDEHSKRRGVAGDVCVFKIAAAAAETGSDIDEVMRISRHANTRTVSLGVAFAGCTLPGAGEPLFTVPTGQMGVGLGIHGEPGIGEEPKASAAELAEMLVTKLLEERPAEWNGRAGVILNGLGSTKYEELFVLWSLVTGCLDLHGVTAVKPEVGELVTSLDMAGCSLTLMFLDDELEPLWLAPCDAVELRRGVPIATKPANVVEAAADLQPSYPPASEASRQSAKRITAVLQAISRMIVEREEELGRIDAYAGDGDHGIGMRRGILAAVEAAQAAVSLGAGARSVTERAADAWADRAGGTSGAIWGILLRGLATRFSDEAGLDKYAIASGAKEALDRVMRLGGARVGDKTLVDAFAPFVETLNKMVAANKSLTLAWGKAAEAAQQAAMATAPLKPQLGRARPLAVRSIGHPDAGAISFAYCAKVVAQQLK